MINRISFLQEAANHLAGRFSDRMHRLAVIFPNRRQAVFFQKHLSDSLILPAFLPRFFTIESFIASLSDKPVAPALLQNFLLHQAYTEVLQENGETHVPNFEQFFQVSETILRDFREADSYLASVEQLYKVLEDLQEIEESFATLSEEDRNFLSAFWQNAKEPGEAQQRFLNLWKRMPAVYQRFYASLNKRGFTTLGACYRHVAAFASPPANAVEQWDHIAFVGFNAFNRAEETILRNWSSKGYCSFYFDADNYYLQNEAQEAGHFLRRNLQKLAFQNQLAPTEGITALAPPIDIVAADGEFLQARSIENWYTRLPENADAAILLADESLLLPVLQSLPPQMQSVNITMGYPLQQSLVFQFTQLYYNWLHQLAQTQQQYVHHTIVTQWLHHPFCDWEDAERKRLLDQITEEGLIQVPVKKLHRHSETAALLSNPLLHPLESLERLGRIIELAAQSEALQQNEFEKGMCAEAWQVLRQLHTLLSEFGLQYSLDLLGQLVHKTLMSVSVPFDGEPLQGVQVMGLLESRGLNFSHILLLGASEGKLPGLSLPSTYLPHNVRRAFGLSVAQHQEAIFAYVLYRLLQRGTHMTAVYNAQVSDGSTGEPSRYFSQLAFESGIKIQQSTLSLAPTEANLPAIVIEKDAWVRQALNIYLRKTEGPTLSPSAINSYLTCRLQFFYRYVARLKETETLSEGVEAHVFGKLVHTMMELLYKPAHASKLICTKAYIEELMQAAPTFIGEAMRLSLRAKPLTKVPVLNGELQVVAKVVLQYVEQLLKLDLAYAPFRVLELEQKLSVPFAFANESSMQQVRFYGYVDRIDEKDGVVRMVDYKTGSDEHEFSGLADLFNREKNKRNKAALQTLLYALLYANASENVSRFEPSLHIARRWNAASTRLYNKATNAAVTATEIPSLLTEVKQNLEVLLAEIFSSQMPFDQTLNLQSCAYCAYAGLCQRK